MNLVAAGFRHNADLPAGAGAIFRRVVAGFHLEFLHRFQAGLQPEGRGDLAVQVARRGIHDGRGFHAVKTNCVLLVGAAREANVVIGTAARRLCARRQQVELRDLPTVDRDLRNFAGVDVIAYRCRTGLDHRQFAAVDGDRCGHRGGLHHNCERPFLAQSQVDVFVNHVIEPRAAGGHRIGRGRKTGDEEGTGFVRRAGSFHAGLVILRLDGGAGDNASRSVGDRARKTARVLRAGCRRKQHKCQKYSHSLRS